MIMGSTGGFVADDKKLGGGQKEPAKTPKLKESTLVRTVTKAAIKAAIIAARQALGTAVGAAVGKAVAGGPVGAAIGVLLTPEKIGPEPGNPGAGGAKPAGPG